MQISPRVLVAEPCEGLLGTLRFAQAQQGVHQQCPRRREEVLRRGEASG